MSRRLRVLLAALLAVVFVASGSSAAWALWSTARSTGSSVTIGKMSASITGTDDMTTTFSSSVTSMTKPVTLTNTGSIAGTTSTVVSVVGGSTDLAQAVSVVAWPVTSTSACTTSTAVGSGSVSGTWASLPSLTTALAPDAAVVWCTRSTPTSSAPPSATTQVRIALTLTAGTWVSTVVNGGFYLNTSAATTAEPALTCMDHDDNYVDLGWPSSSRSKDTYYAAFIHDAQVGDKAQGYSPVIPLAPSNIPADVASSGTQTVVVQVLDDTGARTSVVAGSGTVTLFTKNDGPAIRCGA